MIETILTKLFGSNSEREVKRMMPLLDEIRHHESRYVAMSNMELRAQTAILKERIAPALEEHTRTVESAENNDNAVHRIKWARLVQKELDSILPEAFALVCEAAKRVTGMRMFDVQMLGGIVLHRGSIAEMVTGEGKTLVATLPAFLNALAGKGVHIITVNDFLARRDSEWMRPIYEFLGLTVGLIQHDMRTWERQVGYRADVTFGTNNEFGFDYLRDNMAVRPEMRVQRHLHYAIIDEIDSILIDEARTPLIIAGRPEKSTDIYYKVDDVVRRLRKTEHYEIEEKGHHIMLTEDGMALAEQLLGVEDLYTDETIGLVHMLEQSLKAHNFYKKDDEYVVNNGEVMIVDEFTGRVLEGRRYSDGLHQAIEAKERVTIQFESQTVASVTYQNYFRLYSKISGMTGTAATEASEFAQIYGLEVVQIPTNLPLIRDDMTDLIFASENGKFKHVVNEIVQLHEEGRPVLVGTVSIEKSEKLAGMLHEGGVAQYEILNAKYHEREATIVANAGKYGAITIATNMAGRGTDIKLGEGVRELGGLAIIGTERHESRRIDNQLRGRCGRQGDPGTTRFYLSLEDEVARLFGGDKIKRLVDWFGGDQLDEEPLSQRMVTRSIRRAQTMAEEYNSEIRQHIKKYDDVMDQQRKVIYAMRRDVLEDRDITERLHHMLDHQFSECVMQYAPQDGIPDDWDLDGLGSRLQYLLGFTPHLVSEDDEEPKPLDESIFEQALAEYERREISLAEDLKSYYEEQMGQADTSIDFRKVARKRIHDLEKMALLRAVDDKWIDHLYSMDYLRESVRLRAYGQKDPLLEYKIEGFELFQNMMSSIEENVIQTLFRLTDPEAQRTRRAAARQPGAKAEEQPFSNFSYYSYVAADKEADHSFSSYDTSRFALAGQNPDETSPEGEEEAPRKKKGVTVRLSSPKVKPNDPCPCGSKKKYKKCCGSVQTR